MLLAKMRAVMAKAPVGIAFTRNRRFELVSDEFNRLLGYEGAGLEGEAARLIYASDEFYQGLGTRVAAASASAASSPRRSSSCAATAAASGASCWARR